MKGALSRPGALVKGTVGLAAVAAAVGGIYLAVRGSKKHKSSADAMTAAALNDLPPPLAMDSPQTMMGMQPQPGQFAQREEARRGAPAGQQLGM